MGQDENKYGSTSTKFCAGDFRSSAWSCTQQGKRQGTGALRRLLWAVLLQEKLLCALRLYEMNDVSGPATMATRTNIARLFLVIAGLMAMAWAFAVFPVFRSENVVVDVGTAVIAG